MNQSLGGQITFNYLPLCMVLDMDQCGLLPSRVCFSGLKWIRKLLLGAVLAPEIVKWDVLVMQQLILY